MKDMTGYSVDTCPWRAFQDPFVQRVITAVRWVTGEERGDLRDIVSAPSHKLIQGISFYRAADARMRGKQMEMDREKSRRAAENRGSHG